MPEPHSCTRPYPFSPPDRLVLDPFLNDLREREPVSRIRLPYGGESWLVTRYRDVQTVLSDHRFSRAAATGPDVPRMTPEPGGAASILMTDPPEHTRLRRLVARAFSSRQVQRMRPRVAALADELLTAMADGGPPGDLVEEFALPLPVAVICELLGVPYTDRTRFRGWVQAVMSTTAYTPEQVREALDEFSDYVAELVEQRRATPTDDLLGALVRTRDEDQLLSEEELLTFIGVLLVGGHENTANQIANFSYTLLTRPELLVRLRERPDLLPQAVEELLRYLVIGAGVTFARICTEDVELSGVRMKRGDAVMVSLATANRDPVVFPDPDGVDLTRAHNPHLVFGSGIHHCLGAALARMELQVAIGALIMRFPALRLAVPADAVPWKTGLIVRGPAALPVAW
jgi:cytochrome P450